MNDQQPSSDGLAKFFLEGPIVAPFVTGYRSAGQLPLELVQISTPRGYYPNPAVPDLALHLVTAGAATSRVCFGDRPFAMPTRSGAMVLAPADTECSYDVDGAYGLLSVIIPCAAIGEFVETVGKSSDDLGAVHAGWFEDAFIQQLCLRLWQEAEAGNPYGGLFADHAFIVLAAALFARSGRLRLPDLRRGGLAPSRLKRTLALMEDRLGEELSLSDLAAAVDLSPIHFVRAFRAETGTTPHRFLVERRVERAKSLLRSTATPLAEIAILCGFASQSHLSTWFRRLTGASPKQWRDRSR